MKTLCVESQESMYKDTFFMYVDEFASFSHVTQTDIVKLFNRKLLECFRIYCLTCNVIFGVRSQV